MTDSFTVRSVVVFLGLIVLTCVVGGFVLAYADKSIPAELIGIGAGAAGALAAVLARTSSVPTPEDGASRVTVTTDVTSDEAVVVGD